MKVLIVGASGLIGSAAASALSLRHDIIEASRSGATPIDVSDLDSIDRVFDHIGVVDAIISCTGAVPYKPLAAFTAEDFNKGFNNKAMGQINLVLRGIPYLSTGGSFTLTSGITEREPIREGTVASLVNGALESFVMAAAAELPRGLRINAVSPTVLEEASQHHPWFPGFGRVPAATVGRAYVKSVEGNQTGKIYALN